MQCSVQGGTTACKEYGGLGQTLHQPQGELVWRDERAMLVCGAPILCQARPPASLTHGALRVALLFRPKTQGSEQLSNFMRPSRPASRPRP